MILAASGDDSISEQQKLFGAAGVQGACASRTRLIMVVVDDVTKFHSGNGLPT